MHESNRCKVVSRSWLEEKLPFKYPAGGKSSFSIPVLQLLDEGLLP